MSTTGSRLEVLSTLAGFISSYLALMRGVVQQRRAKHHFSVCQHLIAVEYEPQFLQQNWQLIELPVYIGRGSPETHSSCR